MTKSLGSRLATLRWKKEKPDPEYFRRLGKLSAQKRKEKKYGTDKNNLTEKHIG